MEWAAHAVGGECDVGLAALSISSAPNMLV